MFSSFFHFELYPTPRISYIAVPHFVIYKGSCGSWGTATNDDMKKFFMIAAALLFASSLHAQHNVTQFLGIPIDGSKSEMIRKLIAKGYVTDPYDRDVLEGEFNGHQVRIHVVTNSDKVWRIAIEYATYYNETDLRIAFNTLCRQFQNNPKYLSFQDYNTCIIPDTEDISYEITVHNKRYEAAFFQIPAYVADSTALVTKIKTDIASVYKQEDLANMSAGQKVLIAYFIDMLDDWSKNSVWFMIDQKGWKYQIFLFYDNECNHAQGEDL